MNFSDAIMNAKNLAKAYFGDKKEYELQFNHEEDNCWYIDFPNWGFSHHNLMMVSGADDLCAFLSDDDKFAYVKVIPAKKEENHPGYAKLVQKSHSLFGGSTYQVTGLEGFDRDIWLCPVTLFVLGEYPKYIYLKKSKKPEGSNGISGSDTDKSDNASKPDAVKPDAAKSAGDMSKEEMLKQKMAFAESYYERRVTPDHITSLQPDEVFVFGSNAQGHHGSGAAAFAMRNFGAVWGQGEGMQG